MPDQNFAERTVVSHPGAVAVLALDDAGRVLMIRQYRHPVGYQLWEIPAGLRDAAGEPPLETARRELFEETGYRARDWHVLIDYFTSPGYSTERLRIYLARAVEQAKDDPAHGLRPPRRREVPDPAVGPARPSGHPRLRRPPPQQRRHHRRPRRPVRPVHQLPHPPPRHRPRTLTTHHPRHPMPPLRRHRPPPTSCPAAAPAPLDLRHPDPAAEPPSPVRHARPPLPPAPPEPPTSRVTKILETFFMTEEKHAIRAQNFHDKKVFVIQASRLARADQRSAVPEW